MFLQIDEKLQDLILDYQVCYETIIQQLQDQKKRHDLIYHASIKGYINVLDLWKQFHKDQNSSKDIIEQDYSPRLIDDACTFNQVKTLDWWFQNRSDFAFKYSSCAIDNACEFANLQVLDWWYKHRKDIEMIYDDDAIMWACWSGKTTVLDWWFCHGILDDYITLSWFFPPNQQDPYPDKIPIKYNEQAIQKAIESDYINVIDWWLLHYGELDLKINQETIALASFFDCPHILQSFFDFCSEYEIEMIYDSTAIHRACEGESYNALKWWASKQNIVKI